MIEDENNSAPHSNSPADNNPPPFSNNSTSKDTLTENVSTAPPIKDNDLTVDVDIVMKETPASSAAPSNPTPQESTKITEVKPTPMDIENTESGTTQVPNNSDKPETDSYHQPPASGKAAMEAVLAHLKKFEEGGEKDIGKKTSTNTGSNAASSTTATSNNNTNDNKEPVRKRSDSRRRSRDDRRERDYDRDRDRRRSRDRDYRHRDRYDRDKNRPHDRKILEYKKKKCDCKL